MWSQIRADIGSTCGRKPDPSSHEAQELLAAMHRISEDLFAAGWRDGLESILWSATEDDLRVPLAGGVAPGDAGELAALSENAGGWWIHCSLVGRAWESGDAPGRVFLSLADWRVMYARRAEPGEDLTT